MKKLFYTTDALIFTYNTVDTNTLNDYHQDFYREIVLIKAYPHATEQKILDEVQEIEDKIERGEFMGLFKPILSYTLNEHEKFVIALTYEGFTKIVDLLLVPDSLKRERYAYLAKQLIDLRDKPT